MGCWIYGPETFLENLPLCLYGHLCGHECVLKLWNFLLQWQITGTFLFCASTWEPYQDGLSNFLTSVPF